MARVAYAGNMSYVNALWFATALWVMAVVLVISIFGMSSWGVASILFLGAALLLAAHRFGSAQGTTTSQDIQQQLR